MATVTGVAAGRSPCSRRERRTPNICGEPLGPFKVNSRADYPVPTRKDGFGLRMNTSRAHKLPQAIASDGGGLKLAFAAYELGRGLPELREAP